MIKRILTCILVLVLAFCFVACGNNASTNNMETETQHVDNEEVNIEETESLEPETMENFTEDNSVENTESYNDESKTEIIEDIPKMEYRMAKLYEDVSTERSNLWFVLEFNHHDFGLAVDEPFVIINKKTGENLTDLSWNAENGYVIDIFTGNVCVTNHATEPHGISTSHTDDDAKQYTVQVWAEGKMLSLDDLQILANPYYNGGIWVESLEQEEFIFNADVSEMTTYQPYVHGNTLLELDGKYYISAEDHGSVSGYDNYANGISLRFRYVSGTAEDLFDSLKNNTTFVYGPLAENKDNIGYEEEMYLQEVETPEGTKQWIEVDGKKILFGYQSASGSAIPNEDFVDELRRVILPMYEFEDGKTMIFLS